MYVASKTTRRLSLVRDAPRRRKSMVFRGRTREVYIRQIIFGRTIVSWLSVVRANTVSKRSVIVRLKVAVYF